MLGFICSAKIVCSTWILRNGELGDLLQGKLCESADLSKGHKLKKHDANCLGFSKQNLNRLWVMPASHFEASSRKAGQHWNRPDSLDLDTPAVSSRPPKG